MKKIGKCKEIVNLRKQMKRNIGVGGRGGREGGNLWWEREGGRDGSKVSGKEGMRVRGREGWREGSMEGEREERGKGNLGERESKREGRRSWNITKRMLQ